MPARRSLVVAAVVLAAALASMLPSAATSGSPSGGNPTWELMVSRSADRSDAVPLAGASIDPDEMVAIFVAPLSEQARRGVFRLNGKRFRTEYVVPFDLGGTNRDKTARLVPAARFEVGRNRLTASVKLDRRWVRVSATFDVVEAQAGPTVADVVSGRDDLVTLTSVLSSPELADLFLRLDDTDQEFTVLAPTDAAIEAAGRLGTELLADPVTAANLIGFHVIPGAFTAAELVAAESAVTSTGESAAISRLGDRVFVDHAEVVTVDLRAANGVVHLLSEIVLPDVLAPDSLIAGSAFGADGLPVDGGKANLFTIAGDGSRGQFLGRADINFGFYGYVDVPAGCFYVTLIAPDGFTWESTGRRFQRDAACVGPGETELVDGTLVAAP